MIDLMCSVMLEQYQADAPCTPMQFADKILTAIEAAGMLPPENKTKQGYTQHWATVYYHEWEPETPPSP